MQWPISTIDSIKAQTRYSLIGGPFGSNLTTRDYVDDGVPVIRGVNLPDNRAFHDDDFVYVSDDKADQLSANLAFSGDLIVTQRGTLGQVGLIPEGCRFKRYVLSQSQMKLTVDRAVADPLYVYYYFRQPATVQFIRNHDSSSGVPHINLGVLKDMRIPMPPLVSQQRIAATVGGYDDLIDNNRRRIQLLEDSVRLLFDEWFVRLNSSGHASAATGPGLPAGWSKLPLEEVLVLQRGFDLPSQDREAGEVPIYGSTGIVGFHNKAKVAGPGIVTGRSGTLGEVHFIRGDFWPLNTALWVREFRRVTPLFALHLLRGMNLRQYNGGVSVPTLDRKVVHKAEVLLPPEHTMQAFEEIASDVRLQIDALSRMIDKLRTARDLLLPRLMSGELTV